MNQSPLRAIADERNRIYTMLTAAGFKPARVGQDWQLGPRVVTTEQALEVVRLGRIQEIQTLLREARALRERLPLYYRGEPVESIDPTTGVLEVVSKPGYSGSHHLLSLAVDREVTIAAIKADFQTLRPAFPIEPHVHLRGYPCTGRQWYVAGATADGGGGILEWCDGPEDAQQQLARLQSDPFYFDLSVGSERWYVEGGAKWEPDIRYLR